MLLYCTLDIKQRSSSEASRSTSFGGKVISTDSSERKDHSGAMRSASLFNELINADLSSHNCGSIEKKTANMSQVPRLCQLILEKVKGEDRMDDSASSNDGRIDLLRCHDSSVAHQMHSRFR